MAPQKNNVLEVPDNALYASEYYNIFNMRLNYAILFLRSLITKFSVGLYLIPLHYTNI